MSTRPTAADVQAADKLIADHVEAIKAAPDRMTREAIPPLPKRLARRCACGYIGRASVMISPHFGNTPTTHWVNPADRPEPVLKGVSVYDSFRCTACTATRRAELLEAQARKFRLRAAGILAKRQQSDR